MTSATELEVDEQPIVRKFCLATKWFDDDPMPFVCVRPPEHRPPHRTKEHGGNVGPVATTEWEDDEVTRVHNHPPYRPVCNERRLSTGQLRGACLADDGTDAGPAT